MYKNIQKCNRTQTMHVYTHHHLLRLQYRLPTKLYKHKRLYVKPDHLLQFFRKTNTLSVQAKVILISMRAQAYHFHGKFFP